MANMYSYLKLKCFIKFWCDRFLPNFGSFGLVSVITTKITTLQWIQIVTQNESEFRKNSLDNEIKSRRNERQ